MIRRPPSQLQNLLNLFLLIEILSWSFPVLSSDMTNLSNQKNTVNGYIVGNITTSSGWYERYPNGQIVLYPIVAGSTMNTTTNISSMPSMSGMHGMFGMGGMLGMNNMMGMSNMMGMTRIAGMPSMAGMHGMPSMAGMHGMTSMAGMHGMTSMAGMAGMPPGMAGMSGMAGFPSMGGMTAMYGMAAMSGMIGIASMYGIPPEGYQMTFGRFWIDKEGNLILYPSNNIFYMWGMNKTEGENYRETITSMKDNTAGMNVSDRVENHQP